MDFFTTKYINKIIKEEYIYFVSKYYIDILSNPNKYVSLTEKKISNYLGGGYLKLLNSGTTAIQLGLLSLGVKPGDEVIVPANTYSATAIAVTNIGANIRFCDINLENYTIDINDLEKRITKKTKVIIPVHLYGYSCKMDEILKIGEEYNLKILEDASHAFGGEYMGKKLGTLGDIGIFSTHLTKNFGTFGNGGIFFTKNKKLFYNLSKLIFPDIQNKKVLKGGRTPANMLGMDAVVLLLKLKYIDKIIEENIQLYYRFIDLYKNKGFVFPKINLKENKIHIRNLVVLSKDRDLYKKKGLGKQYYNINLSQNGIFGDIVDLKNTKIFFKKNLALNFYFGKKLI